MGGPCCVVHELNNESDHKNHETNQTENFEEKQCTCLVVEVNASFSCEKVANEEKRN